MNTSTIISIVGGIVGGVLFGAYLENKMTDVETDIDEATKKVDERLFDLNRSPKRRNIFNRAKIA